MLFPPGAQLAHCVTPVALTHRQPPSRVGNRTESVGTGGRGHEDRTEEVAAVLRPKPPPSRRGEREGEDSGMAAEASSRASMLRRSSAKMPRILQRQPVNERRMIQRPYPIGLNVSGA